jgi:hypothetical protein
MGDKKQTHFSARSGAAPRAVAAGARRVVPPAAAGARRRAAAWRALADVTLEGAFVATSHRPVTNLTARKVAVDAAPRLRRAAAKTSGRNGARADRAGAGMAALGARVRAV